MKNPALCPPGLAGRLLFHAFFSVCIVLLLCQPSSGLEASGPEFKGGQMASWRFDNAQIEARPNGDGVIVKGSRSLGMTSPVFSIPQGTGLMRMRFRTARNGLCRITIEAAGGGRVSRFFRMKGGSEARDYDIYFAEGLPAGAAAFMAEFGAMDSIELEIDSVGFYSPSAFELTKMFIRDFMEPDFVTSMTVNGVTAPTLGPLPFVTALYDVIIAVSGIFAVALILRRDPRARQKAVKAVIITFAACALFFSLRMDYNWIIIWREDSRELSGREIDERIRSINGHDLDKLLDFIGLIKRTVPEGRTVRPALAQNGRLAAVARYYLLPVRTSDKADYIWVYGDRDVYLDGGGALKKAGVVIEKNVRLAAGSGEGQAIYEVLR